MLFKKINSRIFSKQRTDFFEVRELFLLSTNQHNKTQTQKSHFYIPDSVFFFDFKIEDLLLRVFGISFCLVVQRRIVFFFSQWCEEGFPVFRTKSNTAQRTCAAVFWIVYDKIRRTPLQSGVGSTPTPIATTTITTAGQMHSHVYLGPFCNIYSPIFFCFSLSHTHSCGSTSLRSYE